MSQKNHNHTKADYVFYLFIDPACPICENLTKSPSFKKMRKIVAANGTIKIEVYNRSDGGIGSFLYKYYKIDGVPTLFNPQNGRKMYVPFRSLTEIENLITHQVGLFEKIAKEEKEEERKERGIKKRIVLKTVKEHFPNQWFSVSDLYELLPSMSKGTIRYVVNQLKESGIFAYDPFERKYKLVTD